MPHPSTAPAPTRAAGAILGTRATRGLSAGAILLGLFALSPGCSDYISDLPEDEGLARVRGIQLSQHQLALDDAGTARLEATLLDTEGDPITDLPEEAELVWFSTDSTRATVVDGTVTAERPGATEVGAGLETPYGTVSVAIPVTIRQVATALDPIAPAEQTGVVASEAADSPAVRVVDRHGDGVLAITVRFTADEGSGSLSDSLVVSDSAGRAVVAWVLGTVAGEQTVRATAEGRDFEPRTFLARAAPGAAAGLAVSPDSVRLTALDAETALEAAAVDVHGNTVGADEVVWTSSDTTVATVAAGVARAVANGLTWVVASAGEGIDSARVVVAQEIATLGIAPASATLTSAGETVDLTATAYDSLGHAMTASIDWGSSNTAVATVSDSGRVTAVADGDAFIRVAAAGVTDSAAITVARVAAAVDVTPSELTVAVGLSGQLGATATDAGGADIAGVSFTWSSSDEAIATVDDAGRVTGVAEGEAFVRAASGELVDSARVTVSAAAALTDPYEPNDATDPTDIAGAAEMGLDAADGGFGLPFRTVSDATLGTAAIEGAADVDAFSFQLSGDSAVTVTLVASDASGSLVARVRDSESGELWLRTLSVGPGGDDSGVIRLAGGRSYQVEISAASPDLTATVPYVLELTGAPILDQDWLNGDHVDGVEPNDLGTLEGAARPAAFPYDVVGDLGGAVEGDLDLMAIPAGFTGSFHLSLDHRGTTGAIDAQLYRRDPATGQLEPVADQSASAVDGASILALLRPADGEPHFLGISGGGLYDLCVRGYYDDCRMAAVQASGGWQFAAPGAVFPDPLVVTVWGTKSWGEESTIYSDPLENVLVKFAADEVMLSSTEVFTDANGQAALSVSAPLAPGIHKVKAWITGAGGGHAQYDTATFELVVPPPLDGVEFTHVSAGGSHTCALDSDGLAYCWGYNRDGQLGIGSTMDEVPVPLPVDTDLRFQTISAGYYHTCAVATDGTGYCWGDGYYTGTGATTDLRSPAAVDYAGGWNTIDTGDWNTCGITDTGEAYCWGDGSYGANGNGSTWGMELSPVATSTDARFTSIAMGIWSACALATTGEAHCWGDGSMVGRAGAHSTNARPLPVDGGHIFQSLGRGSWHVCGISSGDTYCWGDNTYGQHGNGSWSYSVATPTLALSGFDRLEGGEYHTCGVDIDGRGLCWGDNYHWKLGVDDTALPNGESYSPVTVNGPASWRVISGGDDHSCGITTEGVLYCWGFNASGQIGVGTAEWENLLPTPAGLK